MLVQLILGGDIREITEGEFDARLHRVLLTRREAHLHYGRRGGLVAQQQLDLGAMVREAPVIGSSYDGDRHTVEVTFTTGARVMRRGWDGDYYEELDVTPEAVDLSRLEGAPFLNSHSRWSVGDVLGVIEKGWLEELDENAGRALPGYLARAEDGKPKAWAGIAKARFSQREDVAPIERDVADGILRQVSVGYSVQHYERIDDRSDEGRELDLDAPLYVARHWTPLEVSSTPVGADAGATVRNHDRAPTRCLVSVPISRAASLAPQQTREGVTMIRVKIRSTGATEEIRALDYKYTLHELLDDAGREAVRAAGLEVEPAAPAPAGPTQADVDAARNAGAEAERARAGGIRTAVRQAGLEVSVGDEMVARADLTLDAARAEVLEQLASASDALPARSAGLMPRGGLEEDVTRREAMTAALLHRHDPGRYEMTEPGRDFVGMSLVEISRACLERTGETARGMSKMEMVGRAITVGGSDLPNVVANVANKSLRDAYTGAPRTFTAWCRRATLPDFKPASRVQFGQASPLVEVGEHGEFRYAEVADSAEVYALVTYGLIVGLTRQLIVNDDMDALARQPAIFGRASADLESTLVYAVVTANANMADGVALFAAAHGNLTTGPGTAISIASLGVARALMRLQTGLNTDSILNIAPRFLIVPAALETVAQQTVAPISESMLRPGATTDTNPFAGTLEPIAEPRLDADSPTAWYLSGDPAAIDTVEYAFLEGEEGLMTESRQGFEVDGVELKARLDFGVKAIDHRGLYKNDGP